MLSLHGALPIWRLARMGRVPGASAGVRAVVERLVNVLEHTEKGGRLAFAIDVPAGLHLAMQEEHLSEVVGAVLRSEEHTSELVTNAHLVCRLLLEKKKNTMQQ